MIKLNKNQKKFFDEAVKHFKERSTDVRLKDLNEFADEFDLIIPTSALKNYCQEEGQTRGHYNLTLTGIEYIPEVVIKAELHEFKEAETIIIDTPAFADAPTIKKDRVVFDPKGMKHPLRVNDPVHIVSNMDGHIKGVYRDPEKAYDEGRIIVLHDNGNRDRDNVLLELKYTGRSLINSSNSTLWCVIETYGIKH